MKKKLYFIIGIVILLLLVILVPSPSKKVVEQETLDKIQAQLSDAKPVVLPMSSQKIDSRWMFSKRRVEYGLGVMNNLDSSEEFSLDINYIPKPDLCYYEEQNNWLKIKDQTRTVSPGEKEIFVIEVGVPWNADPCIYEYEVVVRDSEGNQFWDKKKIFAVVKS